MILIICAMLIIGLLSFLTGKWFDCRPSGLDRFPSHYDRFVLPDENGFRPSSETVAVDGPGPAVSAGRRKPVRITDRSEIIRDLDLLYYRYSRQNMTEEEYLYRANLLIDKLSEYTSAGIRNETEVVSK